MQITKHTIVPRLGKNGKPQKNKLKATWTVQAMQDLDITHGVDLESEIAKILADEIDKEILAEILNEQHSKPV